MSLFVEIARLKAITVIHGLHSHFIFLINHVFATAACASVLLLRRTQSGFGWLPSSRSAASRSGRCGGIRECVCVFVFLRWISTEWRELWTTTAANEQWYHREQLEHWARREHVTLQIPELKFCTDNAAMITALGTRLWQAGRRHDLDLEASTTTTT